MVTNSCIGFLLYATLASALPTFYANDARGPRRKLVVEEEYYEWPPIPEFSTFPHAASRFPHFIRE